MMEFIATNLKYPQQAVKENIQGAVLAEFVIDAEGKVTAPQIISVMTPVADIRTLAVEVLRIEAFAEPMFAAAIVAYGVFIGAGSTLAPSLMNFGSIWGIRLPLAFLLAPAMGLRGVWLAMCIELCFRGAIFLVRLWGCKWEPPS